VGPKNFTPLLYSPQRLPEMYTGTEMALHFPLRPQRHSDTHQVQGRQFQSEFMADKILLAKFIPI
jgi:hypothetical protein